MDLEDTYTVEEAARVLHRSVKTIYRYLKDGRLQAIRKGDIYLISKESVEALLQAPVHFDDNVSRQVRILAGQLGDMRAQLADMSRQIFDLQEAYSELKSKELHKTIQQMPAYPPHVDKLVTEKSLVGDKVTEQGPIWIHSISELPEDAITLYQFADLSGIKRHTLRDFVLKHNMSHYAMPNPSRPKETERYVSGEQQEAIRRARLK